MTALAEHSVTKFWKGERSKKNNKRSAANGSKTSKRPRNKQQVKQKKKNEIIKSTHLALMRKKRVFGADEAENLAVKERTLWVPATDPSVLAGKNAHNKDTSKRMQ